MDRHVEKQQPSYRFKRQTDIPESFFPEDVLGKNLPVISELAKNIGAEGEYNRFTQGYVVKLPDKVTTGSTPPSLTFEPNVDYREGNPESLKPTATYMSGDGKLNVEINQVGEVRIDEDGRFVKLTEIMFC